MSVVRLPFLWERIQPSEIGSLDGSGTRSARRCGELRHRQGPEDRNRAAQLRFWLRLINDSAQTPNSAFADLWGKLAVHYKSNPGVIFGLMNEPHDQPRRMAWLRERRDRRNPQPPGRYRKSWCRAATGTEHGVDDLGQRRGHRHRRAGPRARFCVRGSSVSRPRRQRHTAGVVYGPSKSASSG